MCISFRGPFYEATAVTEEALLENDAGLRSVVVVEERGSQVVTVAVAEVVARQVLGRGRDRQRRVLGKGRCRWR